MQKRIIYRPNEKIILGDRMFNNRIADIRSDANLSQEDVARILKVSRQNYSRWETNERFIPLARLKVFSDYFKVSYDYIFRFSRKNNYSKSNLDKTIIGAKIKKLRKEKGLTQIELANMLNTTHSTISEYETGKNLILTAFAYQIAQKFNISMDYLCSDKE